ncbi:MAG TPA: thiol peroxidase [Syntrophobacteria bacterium]|nr:thiol peroxidase [Syntrophobacteria bacterium]
MNLKKGTLLLALSLSALLVGGCAASRSNLAIDKGSAAPGGSITRGGQSAKLDGKPIALGDPLPSVTLVDAMTMKPVDISTLKGSVLFLSIVPSIDTAVCEAQTHYLGEQGDKLPPQVKRITISRDTPFAQKRFAKEAKLENIQYLSDYKEGEFGRSTGLLVDDLMLLARSVIIVDRDGKVRYIQVVPEITHLPDMETAFQKATELAKGT